MMPASLFARITRSIFAEFTKEITFKNGVKDTFTKSWEEVDPMIKTQYYAIGERLTSNLVSLPKKLEVFRRKKTT